MLLFDLYYHEGRFYLMDKRGRFKAYTKDDTKNVLKLYGLHSIKAPRELLSHIDKTLAECCLNKVCEYAGPLACYQVGEHTFGNNRILVTSGPKIIKAENKPFPKVEWILNDLFLSKYEHQLPYVFG